MPFRLMFLTATQTRPAAGCARRDSVSKWAARRIETLNVGLARPLPTVDGQWDLDATRPETPMSLLL